MINRQTSVLKALSDETRLRIMNVFVTSGEALCVCEVVDALHLPQYQISKHLAILKNAGVIDVEKDGTWGYHYLITDDPLNKMLFSFLKKYLVGEVFDDDIKQLDLRLLLREEGRCVVGFVGEKHLPNKIKVKKQKQTVKE